MVMKYNFYLIRGKNMKCVCNGIYDFCKSFKNDKVPKDIHTFRCPCGQYLYIIKDTIWYGGYPLDLSKIE